MAQKLSDLPLKVLRQILAATEKSAGSGSVSAAIIRREIERRECPRQEATR